MRRGIISTLITYSLIQVVCLTMVTVVDFINYYVLKFEHLNRNDFRFLFMFFSFIGIVLLGFHLNRKYQNLLTYWKYIVVGLCVLIISYIVFHIGYITYRDLFKSTIPFSMSGLLNNFIKNIPQLLEYLGYSITLLFIVSIFRKKLKFGKLSKIVVVE